MEWRGIGQHSSGATIPRQALMARRMAATAAPSRNVLSPAWGAGTDTFPGVVRSPAST
jgi:hypothetical protein